MFTREVSRTCARGMRGRLPKRVVRRLALLTLTGVELLVLLACVVRPAYAYIDPGSGLLAVQVGGSMLAGALFVLRSKIRKIFGRMIDSRTEGETAAEAGVEP